MQCRQLSPGPPRPSKNSRSAIVLRYIHDCFRGGYSFIRCRGLYGRCGESGEQCLFMHCYVYFYVYIGSCHNFFHHLGYVDEFGVSVDFEYIECSNGRTDWDAQSLFESPVELSEYDCGGGLMLF